ncbi:MAG: hypothetical protein RIC35_04990 [Marinoscillum sp.]
MMKHNLSFYTAYNQFYIRDKDSNGDTGSPTFWSQEAFKDRLAEGDGLLGVSTESYGFINGYLYLLEKPKDLTELDVFDHVVEASVQIKSGVLQIIDCPNSSVELEIKLSPGVYRVRIYSLGLGTDEDDEGDDSYIIELWPDSKQNRKVIKRWNKS